MSGDIDNFHAMSQAGGLVRRSRSNPACAPGARLRQADRSGCWRAPACIARTTGGPAWPAVRALRISRAGYVVPGAASVATVPSSNLQRGWKNRTRWVCINIIAADSNHRDAEFLCLPLCSELL